VAHYVYGNFSWTAPQFSISPPLPQIWKVLWKWHIMCMATSVQPHHSWALSVSGLNQESCALAMSTSPVQHAPIMATRWWLCFVLFSRQNWEKVNLKINDNNTITFNQRKIFKFSPELSAGDVEDMVVVPNIPMLVSMLLNILKPCHWLKYCKLQTLFWIFK
jgi:hypothetical protein